MSNESMRTCRGGETFNSVRTLYEAASGARSCMRSRNADFCGLSSVFCLRQCSFVDQKPSWGETRAEN